MRHSTSLLIVFAVLACLPTITAAQWYPGGVRITYAPGNELSTGMLPDNTGGAVITSSVASPFSRIISTAAASASNPSRSRGRQARAASVSVTPRPARRNNSTPRYSSSAFTWWLTAACVMCSSTAASLKDKWRAAASNTRNALSGGRR